MNIFKKRIRRGDEWENLIYQRIDKFYFSENGRMIIKQIHEAINNQFPYSNLERSEIERKQFFEELETTILDYVIESNRQVYKQAFIDATNFHLKILK